MRSLFDRLADHGIELRHYRKGTQRLPCPECGKGAKDAALAVTLDHDRAVWQCFRCGFKGAVRDRSESSGRPPERPQATRSEPERHEVLSDRWREFWAACERVTPTSVAGRYLAARGCALPPTDGDLRWHAEAWHWPTQARMPAVVARITDARTCTPLSLHFTYLKPDGSGKADVERAKLLLPKHRKAGGVIRLWPDEAVTQGLGIAEGIETALTVAQSMTPVWSCVDAGNLAALPVLCGIDSLLIAVDFDPAGLKAAEACAIHWSDAGREVRMLQPREPGHDINDEYGAAA